jgi:hypothetical protein
MGQKIILTEKVIKKLDKLENVLFDKEYHGFRDTSKKYIDNIIDAIFSIPEQKHHETKNPKIGKWFVRYKVNSKTTYYITFDFSRDNYLIQNVITNHEKAYKKIFGIG